MRRSSPRGAAVAVIAVALIAATAPTVAADHEYKEAVTFNWETTELDVTVVGVEDPVVVRAIGEAIEAWRTGLRDMAPNGLGQELVIRDYIPGSDVTPPQGYEPTDLEIVFVPQGFFAARILILPSQQCFVAAPMSYEALGAGHPQYRVALHEFGHCLGLGHVYTHGVQYNPQRDPMGGGRDHPACPSNLNLEILQKGFNGEQGEVVIDSGQYNQSDCSGPSSIVG